MEAFFIQAVRYVALGMEAGSAVLIAAGGIQALYRVFTAPLGIQPSTQAKKDVWLHFGMWLLLGLEFELGADAVKTAIAADVVRHRAAGRHRDDPGLPGTN